MFVAWTRANPVASARLADDLVYLIREYGERRRWDAFLLLEGDRIQVLDALARKGVGLGFGHYGVEVPAGAPGEAMQRWIGGYYETRTSRPVASRTRSRRPTSPKTLMTSGEDSASV